MSLSEIRLKKQNLHTQAPKKYGVYLLNDDYTTMDFVVEILCTVFKLPENQAIQIMLQIHHEGRALCGVYSLDIAQTKQHQVLTLAQNAEFPLMCQIEEVE